MSAQFDQIKSTFDGFSDAWRSNDGPAVASFFVEDGTLINPFGQRADGRTSIAAMYAEYFGGMLRGTSTTFNLASVRAVETNHAFADGSQTVNARDGSVVLVVPLPHCCVAMATAGASSMLGPMPSLRCRPE